MRIDRTGITPTDLAGYVEQERQLFRTVFGDSVALQDETPQGQIIGIDALGRAQADEVAVSIANGMSLGTASGFQLDNWSTLLSIPRRAGSRSTVEVQLSGTPGTTIPAGTQARSLNNAQVVFETTEDILIPDAENVTSATAVVTFEAGDPAPDAQLRIGDTPAYVFTDTDPVPATPANRVLIGGDPAERMAEAINGAAAAYISSSTTANALVTAAYDSSSPRRMVLTARVPGTQGNLIQLTSNHPGIILDTLSLVGGDDGQGLTTTIMQATEDGPIVLEPGALVEIVNPITGWGAVSNRTAATLGRLPETDAEYRTRYNSIVAHNGRGDLDNISAQVSDLEGVQAVAVFDNDTDAEVTTQGTAIAEHSILVAVQGGDDDEIAQAIFRTKPAGIPTIGATVINIEREIGTDIVVRFARVTEVPIRFVLDIRVGPAFPVAGLELIQTRCVEWIGGTFNALTGRFDTTGIGIGESIDASRALTPVQSVPGHEVISLSVQLQDGSNLPTVQGLTSRYTLVADDVNITISA